MSRSELDLLLDFLNGRDAACPRCGYNLRDLTGDRCPECGDQLVLKVNLVEPRMGAFLTGLVALASAAGFNGLLLVYVAYQIVVRGQHFGAFLSKFISINACGLIVTGIMLLLWMGMRFRFRRRPRLEQWLLAASLWIVPLIDAWVFAANIR